MFKKTYALSEYIKQNKKNKKEVKDTKSSKNESKKLSLAEKFIITVKKDKKEKINEDIKPKKGIKKVSKKDIKQSNKDIKSKAEEKTSLKDKITEVRTKLKEHSELQKEIGKLEHEWKEVMVNKKCYNEGLLTFTLGHIKKEDFGWSSRVYSPYGNALEQLEALTPAIESGLKCKFMFNIPEHNEFAMCKIIYPEQIKCNTIPFQPCKVKPYELYIGVDITGKKIVQNINHTPHVLLAGQTRKGKNGSLDHILTSLIYSCTPQELELYLFQCAKNDLIKYANCEQVRCFVLGDFKKMEEALEHLMKEIDRRIDLMQPMVKSLKGDNLFDYNKLYPSRKLPYTYVVIDEFMVLMLPTKDKKIAESKTNILAMLEKIGEMGGSVGINYMIAHQKPEKALCPSFIKNMSLIRICFGFDDESCGRIVLGEKYGDLALKLPARRAYYSADGKIDLIFTTNLREEDGSSRIKQFIQKSVKPNHRMLFDDFKKQNQPEDKIPKNNNDSKENRETIEVGKGVVELPSIQKPKNVLNKDTENKEVVTTITKKQEIVEVKNEINDLINNQQRIQEKGIKEIKTNFNLDETPKEEPKIPNLNLVIGLDFNKVDPTSIIKKEEIIKENISKIPSYVPYNPNLNINIIDKTKIDLSEKNTMKKQKYEKDVILNDNEDLHN